MADLKATQMSKTDEWETPTWLIRVIEEEFGPITLDPCATAENSKGLLYFPKEDNGLIQQWHGLTFVNPPYSEVAAWTEKSYQEAFAGNATVLLLVAARTDTRWWWKWVRQGEVRLIQGRLRFDLNGEEIKVSAPFPSALVIFRRYVDRYSPSTVYWDIPKEMRK